ncbi:hypothetical protein DFH08DRAFT_927872 [Mycena albidolilacea]|uniref:Uncharacterized protein n=1 Tax=Mycena albidolilacea TaxID=1033008 RepID=A0AAD6YY66_9AGAR|nr:hypothetical protein DFH08DRAFT_927872 [Mycena albidolilacea]
MPVTFTVASHPGNSWKPTMLASRGLSPKELLAGLGPDTGQPSPYENIGVIRGTSFSGEEAHVNASQSAATKTKSRLLRLSKLFTRKKADDVESKHPTPKVVSESKSPTLQGIEIPTTKGFGSTVILDGRPAMIDAGDVDNVPTTPVVQPSPTPQTPPASLSQGTIATTYQTGGRDTLIKNVFPRPNGFVDTIISAYNNHHALILRPDDVWITILTQFNFYVNANAELLRANFVAHEGKKELTVTTARFNDFGRLAREMVDLIEKNVVDPSLRAWALPEFSTTTVKDTTVSSIVLMATLKAYFEYVYCEVCCGIPRVTLEGEKRDWEKILQRLEKLKEYGLEMIAWYHLLVPVISRFVKAFEDPNGKSNVDFWQSVAHFQPGGSGPSYYSGWITAFCVFNDKGEWLGPRLETSVQSSVAPETLTPRSFWETYKGYAGGLVLDGTRFHRIDCDNIPPSFVEADVRLVSFNTGENRQCSMTAGVVGTRVCSSNDSGLSSSGRDDTVRPVIGWWLFNKD